MSDLAELLRAPGAAVEADDDIDAINALYLERGWSDGLPIVPPTAARVEKMLEYCDRPLNESIAKIALLEPSVQGKSLPPAGNGSRQRLRMPRGAQTPEL